MRTLFLLFAAGCAAATTECPVELSFGPTGESCRTGDLEADEAACCPDGFVGVGYNAAGELVCLAGAL
jgi:hypothetical protein